MVIRSIAHEEIGKGRSRIIVDTSEIKPGRYETMALRPSGRELACKYAAGEDQAMADFAEVLAMFSGNRFDRGRKSV